MPVSGGTRHTGVSSCKLVDVHVDWEGQGYRSSNTNWEDRDHLYLHAALRHRNLQGELGVLRVIVLLAQPKISLCGEDFAVPLQCYVFLGIFRIPERL